VPIEYYSKKCKCGCDKLIPKKSFHKYYGIPDYICGHSRRGKPGWNKGKKLSLEIVQKIKDSRKKSKTKIKQSPEHIAKRLAATKAHDPNGDRYKKANMTRAANLASGAVIKKSSWNKGGHLTKEWAEKIRKKAIERHITFKERDLICEMYADRNMTSVQIAKKYKTNSAVIVKRLRECDVAIKGIAGFKKGVPLTKEHIKKSLRRRIPTSLEMKFIDIINKNKLPYKFVGDGSFILAGKNPDFINVNGKKIAIEVYAEYFKTLKNGSIVKWMENRKQLFKEYGWELLFFNEKQVNDNYILESLD